jgi:diguanylate cyclase (GGDEF)-like protein
MRDFRDVIRPVLGVHADTPGGQVYDRFSAEPDTLIIPILDSDHRPIGLVERNGFFLRMAAEFGRALYGRRPISALMEPDPLLVEVGASLEAFTTDSLTDRPSDLLSGFIVTDQGRYLGVATALELLQLAHERGRRNLERIAHLAHFDALTDLPNRVLFRRELQEALARARRADEETAVLCIDLDHFKTVNDTLGHPVGDALLQAVADRLRHCVREGDSVARLGGDEFAVVQAGPNLPAGAGELADRVVAAMAEPFVIQGHQVVIGASVGIAIAPTDAHQPDELLKKADMALYRVKAEGRGGFHFFEKAMDERLQARRTLELDLRHAVAAGEFELHFQPLMNLATGRVGCCEALLRWASPQRGLVSPADFIPLAEEIGLIVPLGEWVLREACRQAAEWPSHVRVAVNISPAQFRSRNLLGVVMSALAASGLEAERLELEITESVLLQDNAANLAVLHSLRDVGVRISMDDFGTGYSSLSYLRSFPFDKIKIDQSFVRDLPTDPDAMAIVRAVTGLGASLGMSTTAEGVETADQLEELKRQGCDEIQGYLISRPVPAAQIAYLLGAVPDMRPPVDAPVPLRSRKAANIRSDQAASAPNCKRARRA